MSWIDISQAIGGIATAVALFFVAYQASLTQQQLQQTREEMTRAETGYLRLGLVCSSECKRDENYLICKTSLENTSRRPIIVKDAFLLIVDQSVSFEKGINIVIEEINRKRPKTVGSPLGSENGVAKPDLITIREYLEKNDNLLHIPDKFSIIYFPIYFKTLVKLGSFAHNRSTHIQIVTGGKVYSIYFAVFGEEWYKKGDTSQGRVVHDEVLVK